MNIQLIDIKRQYQEYKSDIDEQIRIALNDATFIMGRQVSELETELAKYVGTRYAVGCASGTEALQLVLMSYGIQPDDEIITTPFTFIATAEVISLLGAKPVFVDIRPDTLNINPQLISKAVTSKTKGIIPVNIFGQCADYDEINSIAQKHGLFVIEDASQSFGALYKGRRSCSLADAGCTSFFPAKPLGCYGDGGMIFTNDQKMAEVVKSLRIHGAGQEKYEHIRIGMNSRLDTLQAAILLAKFKHFTKEIELRQKIAEYYTDSLRDSFRTPQILSFNKSVFAQYNLLLKDRNTKQMKLKEKQIPTAVYYPRPLHLQPAYRDSGYQPGDFPVSESICETILALPMHPFLTKDEQDYIIQQLKNG